MWVVVVGVVIVCCWAQFAGCVAASEVRTAAKQTNETLHPDTPDSETRVYSMKRVAGAGCPYTASWLAHVNLYRKVKYWVDITKMEAASFTMYDTAKHKFQLSDPGAYFVHHMSMFEHLNHKAHGFEVAHNKSVVLAGAAVQGECVGLHVSTQDSYVALIPFYGGLPPNVTKDLSVKSIGQGNSLVDASTKALQTLATVCSCLRYFGNVVVGVARNEDRALMLEMIQRLEPGARPHVNVIQLRLQRPAFLPFHLLAWGQHFARHQNCRQFYAEEPGAGVGTHAEGTGVEAGPGATNVSAAIAKGVAHFGFREGRVDPTKVPAHVPEYEICLPRAVTPYSGGPVQVLYMRRPASFIEKARQHRSASGDVAPAPPLRYVYFSECDQVVRFDDLQTFRALSAASNESTFFAGRRKEKRRDSDPRDYMGGLDMWRECGVAGYSLTWPASPHVHQDT